MPMPRRKTKRDEFFRHGGARKLVESHDFAGRPGLRVACGKICHPSRSEAKSAAKKTTRMGNDKRPDGILMPYWCDLCDAWHIGHTRNPKSA